MKFKLDFQPASPEFRLNIRTPVALWGSCFAEHMASKLERHKFTIVQNPNGIQYNPISLFQSVADCLSNAEIRESSLFESNGLWHSWDHHGRFSAPTRDDLMQQIRFERTRMYAHLKEAGCLIFTFGNAWVYELKALSGIVTNCHKMPASTFTKRLLDPEEIVHAFQHLLADYPELQEKQIIFTVSPVRYSKDGLVENNLSKAVLLQAVHHCIGKLKHGYYFPAYEIVLDELRDYRFYDTDMVHPNAQAIQYVYERFAETVFDAETKAIVEEVEEIVLARNHRHLHPGSNDHRKFLEAYQLKTATLAKKYPFLDWGEEMKYFAKD